MDRDRRDEQVLAWLMEEDLEDIEDRSFRTDDIESDRDSETVIIPLTPNNRHRK